MCSDHGILLVRACLAHQEGLRMGLDRSDHDWGRFDAQILRLPVFLSSCFISAGFCLQIHCVEVLVMRTLP